MLNLNRSLLLFVYWTIFSALWAELLEPKRPRNITGDALEFKQLPSFPDVDHRALTRAQELIDNAIVEVGKVNQAIVDNPRRNTYDKSHPLDSATYLHPHRGLSNTEISNTTASLVTTDVIKAAAMLAEHYATTSSSKLFELPALPEGIVIQRTGNEVDETFWMESISHSGQMPFGNDPNYKVFRSVSDYGAKGDGRTDDTAAINKAISDGGRCGKNCKSSTVKGALVYFPSGTYLISSSIVSYYNTQLIGNPNKRPILKAAPSFVGLGVIDVDPYYPGLDPGVNWYTNQANFLRQIRNFVIDISQATIASAAGMHYQVGQGTSLQNILFIQNPAPDTTQQGIFSENGSGGFMSDLAFAFGKYGIYGGNQQFTVRNLLFSNCKTSIRLIWDWGWTWKSISIMNSDVGVSLVSENGKREVGSVFFADSIFTDTKVGIEMSPRLEGNVKGNTLITLDNVEFTSTPIAVQDTNKATILPGNKKYRTWTLGNVYHPDSPNGTFTSPSGSFDFMNRPQIEVLGGGPNGGFFERSKPQYETVPASGFTNVKNFNARGDGQSDDTAAIKNALSKTAGNSILYFPAGSYIVTDTITIPAGTKIVGEVWSQIVGSGPRFSDINSPYVMVRVGEPGQLGDVEISDMLFSARGATAGIVLMEWNMQQTGRGTSGMWDSHFRIGGAQGTGLTRKECPNKSGGVKKQCIAGALLLHLTRSSSAYLENVWGWVADHDIDDPDEARVDVYVARGFLIESQGPLWLYGTASEHSVLYQYHLEGASNVYMSMIQTESPYYQPNPALPVPFGSTLGRFSGDMDVEDCAAVNPQCSVSWGLRSVSSSNVVIAGAGLYSWFQDYVQDCVGKQDCQQKIVSTTYNWNFWLYNLITIGSTQMVSPQRPETPTVNSKNRVAKMDDDPTTTVISTSTVVVSPAPVPSCPPGTGPLDEELNKTFFPAYAADNTVAQNTPHTAVIVAWLIDATKAHRCYKNKDGLVNTFWIGMGDSYGSGIGAGTLVDNEDGCQRWNHSTTKYLHEHKEIYWFGFGMDVFVACSGHMTLHMFIDPVWDLPNKGKVSQNRKFLRLPHDMAVVSIGGNDIGFFDIMDACLFRFYDATCFGWSETAGICDRAIANATSVIMRQPTFDNLYRVYSEILDNARPLAGKFTLFVTSYPRFFSVKTRDCDQDTLAYWKHCYQGGACIKHGAGPDKKIGPFLTLEHRKRLNDLTDRVNGLIARVVKAKAESMAQDARMKDNRRILFVDYNDKFDGHRFCEPGVREPFLGGDKNFFFVNRFDRFEFQHSRGTDWDLDPDGKPVQNIPPDQFFQAGDSLGNVTLPDAGLCRELYREGRQWNLDWGMQAACQTSMGIDDTRKQNREGLDWVCLPSIDMSHAVMSRIMHPKSWGQAMIVQKILDTIHANPWR